VLCGGMIPVYDPGDPTPPPHTNGLFATSGEPRAGLAQAAWLVPGRWGFAAAASSINFPHLVELPQIPTNDPIWAYKESTLLTDLGMLGVLSLVYAGVVRWRIRLKH